MNYYFQLIITILISFSWYYATLPGSLILSNEKNKKPTMYDALISWLLFYIPLTISMYYLYITYFSSKENICSYVDIVNKMMCLK